MAMRIDVIHGKHVIGTNMACEDCNGSGTVYRITPEARAWADRHPLQPLSHEALTCPRCGGTGRMVWNNAYTYETTEAVGVGDVVLVPGNKANAEPQLATVVQVGSSYYDRVQAILGVVERKGQDA